MRWVSVCPVWSAGHLTGVKLGVYTWLTNSDRDSKVARSRFPFHGVKFSPHGWGATRPPIYCPVRSVVLDSSCPVWMEVPFPEISIQSKHRPAAQTQQGPFRSAKQKEQRGNKGRGCQWGDAKGRFEAVPHIRLHPLLCASPFFFSCIKKEWNMVFIASWRHYLRMHISLLR